MWNLAHGNRMFGSVVRGGFVPDDATADVCGTHLSSEKRRKQSPPGTPRVPNFPILPWSAGLLLVLLGSSCTDSGVIFMGGTGGVK